MQRSIGVDIYGAGLDVMKQLCGETGKKPIDTIKQ